MKTNPKKARETFAGKQQNSGAVILHLVYNAPVLKVRKPGWTSF